MNRVALKGLAFRRGRTLLTTVAIVVGVAMVSGTYVLTDTISSAFDSIFQSSFSNTSAVISGRSIVSGASGNATVPESLVARVRRLPGVQAAAGAIFDTTSSANKAQLLDKQGKAISVGGAPNFGFGFDPSESRFNPMQLTAGRFATTGGQVVIDKGTADKYGYDVGQQIAVSATGPAREFTISGIAKFGSVNSLGGATIAVFDVATAQRLLDKRGRYDVIFLAANPGSTPGELISQVKPLLPATAQVQTGAQQAADQAKNTQQALTFIRYFLLAFAGIAVLVGAFVTFNTISITVAQRIREFATLRSLGASRRQVLRSVLIESLVTGLLASVVGLVAGLGLAVGLNALFTALGVSLPTSGLVFAGRTVIVSLLLGVAVTVLSSLIPALRATRIPPVSAMREGATLPPTRVSRRRGLIVSVLAAVTAALLAYGSFGGAGIDTALLFVLAGCLGLFLVVGLAAAPAVGPLAWVVGAPARRFAGEAGVLASENATRNPVRTARTAAALMVGLALVTIVATLGAGLRNSDRQNLSESVSADYVITSNNGFDPFPRAAGAALANAPGVTGAADQRQDRAKAFGSDTTVTGAPPNFTRFFDLHLGPDARRIVGGLGAHGAVVETGYADDHGLQVGSTFRLTTPSGQRLALKVAGISAPPTIQKLDPLAGTVVISKDAFDGSFPQPQNQFTFVDVRGGPSAAATARLEHAMRGFSNAKVATRADWIDARSGGIAALLNLLYILLALSVVVSLFGMVNTLVLSVFERTREIGMLRAVGMKRRQVRRMIRAESVITALIGAGLGLPLGVFLAAVFTKVLSTEGIAFSLPVGSLVAFTAVAIFAGIAAAVIPARRAAKLEVLSALHYE